MNTSRMLFAFALLFSSTASTLTMQENDSSLQDRVCAVLSQENPGPDAFFTTLGNNALTELSTSDIDTQYHAYAAAIHCDDYKALQKLENANIPIPNTPSLAYMFAMYALPYKAIRPPIKCSLDPDYRHKLVAVPDKPRLNAIRWCLEHDANPKCFRHATTYTPWVLPIHACPVEIPIQLNLRQHVGQGNHYWSLLTSDAGIVHPLIHVAVYADKPESTLKLMKEHGILLNPLPKNDFAAFISHATRHYPYPQKVDPKPKDDFYKYNNEHEVRRQKIQKLCEILTLNMYKDVTLPEYCVAPINQLIRENRWSPSLYSQAGQLDQQLELHTAEGIAAQERQHHSIAAFLKSLLNCDRSAQQVILQNN